MRFDRILQRYDYHVPPHLIAQQPARPRDSARLLVYDRKTKKIFFDTFRNLGKHLPPKAVLVFNQTKVIPARLTLTKQTGGPTPNASRRRVAGGKVRVLYLATEGENIRVLADRALSHDEILRLTKRYSFTVIKRVNNQWLLKPSFSMTRLQAIFDRFGVAPLPPYIKHSPLTEAERKAQYQTVFAKASGSVAAPTASLHFTKGLIARLKRQGFGVEFVTLHVNLGTFAPLTNTQLQTKRLHSEWFAVDTKTARALAKARRAGRPIIAVGTTVARTLEASGGRASIGATRLFIQPGYKWKMVDGLITNFHVPKSSLLMLVASLTGRTELLALYQKALRRRMRFFSFGDGMLVR